MDLTTHYLGLTLAHPLMLGASPLVDDLDAVRRAEDVGAAAIVMHSLFEEQIERERSEHDALARHEESFAEALYFSPHRSELALDLDELEVAHRLELSTSADILLRLRWLAILSAQVNVSFAVSGGVHSAEDIVKVIMAGAHGVQLVSEVLAHGLHRFAELRADLVRWFEAHEYHSLAQARGSMNLARCPDPKVYERVSYLRILNSWRPPTAPSR